MTRKQKQKPNNKANEKKKNKTKIFEPSWTLIVYIAQKGIMVPKKNTFLHSPFFPLVF